MKQQNVFSFNVLVNDSVYNIILYGTGNSTAVTLNSAAYNTFLNSLRTELSPKHKNMFLTLFCYHSLSNMAAINMKKNE